MLQDITLGQFFPGNSVLHRLDPRTKIVAVFALMVPIFAAQSLASYALLSAATVAMICLSKVPPLTVLKSLKPLAWLILFTWLIHVFSHGGEVLAKFWLFEATREGIVHGAKISLRLVLLILMASLLTLTTSPLKLTDATEKLLSPLNRIGMPAHELAMMMTIALRFVPTLLEETDRIVKAQKSRGLDFESGSFVRRLRAMIPILVPMFVSSFRRADDLAMAMEARCYRGGEGRTHMKRLHMTALDFGAAVTVAIICAGVIFLRGA
ncbi:MAG: energy-coupling factor transporter transmembrane protein EcfT [Quinella sp. 2Q5]|nr:energy-coupling factor transporter transmembrane protein EcfT [Quinella sp. 2Q5]